MQNPASFADAHGMPAGWPFATSHLSVSACGASSQPACHHVHTRLRLSGTRTGPQMGELAGRRTNRQTDRRTDGRTGPRTDGRTGGLLTLAWLISDLHLNTTTIAYPRMNTKQRHGENSPLSYSTCCWVLQANACCCCSYPATVRCWCSNKM